MSQGNQPPHAPQLAADLPQHARERLVEMKEKKLFTSDFSVNEFLLVREAGFEPLGLVMGSSIYQATPQIPRTIQGQTGCELWDMTRALYHARELAMNRMEEEADALEADGIIGVRVEVNMAIDPLRQSWDRYCEWREWNEKQGFGRQVTNLGYGWQRWEQVAWQQWQRWCQQRGWGMQPPPWAMPRNQPAYALGQNVIEFVAIGTAVRNRDGEHFRNARGKPFQSDLNGQEFWMLVRAGYRPVGFVMGNCVYYVPPNLLRAPDTQSCELSGYTHGLYDARELAIERLQDEGEALGATGIVGVTVSEQSHSWRTAGPDVGNAALRTGELIELFVLGTAVIPMANAKAPPKPELVRIANDPPRASHKAGE
jgi:uncharacterized protein YbjQ (UPF0145 family)